MKNKNKAHLKDQYSEFGNNLHSAWIKMGAPIPTTDDEVKYFEEVYGTTEIPIPIELTDPNNIHQIGATTNKKNKTQQKDSSKQNKNDYFKKLVLAAEIASQLHAEPTFGHVKFVKIYCICTEIGKMKLSTNYGKYAAGPLDPKLMYTIDAEFKRRNWFSIKKSSFGYKYSPDVNSEDYKKYYNRYFSNHKSQIDHLINLFRKKESGFCEIVATLYFVWKDLLENKSIISEAFLFKGFYQWDQSKSKYKENELKAAFEWMNENEIVPAQ